MKREGRIHGSNVRLGKRAWGDGGYRGKVTFNRPTNQSKSAVKLAVPSVVQLVSNEHELPMQKSIGKTKSAFKAKDLDITRNHLMQDWSIYKRGVPVEENYDDEGLDDPYHYREHWASDDYGNGGHDEDEGEDDDEDEEEQQVDEEEEYWDADNRSRSQIVLPIESLLTVRKRKIAPAKANAVQPQPRRQQQLTLTDAVGVAEITVERAAADDGNNSDQFESWWGLGFYDEEEVPDDWFLITEEEDFAVAA